MHRLFPGAQIQIVATDSDRLWFLPIKGNVVETMTNLRGRVVRCELSHAIPLRNTEISQVILLVDSNLDCDVFMGLSNSLTTDPILHLGKAKVA